MFRHYLKKELIYQVGVACNSSFKCAKFCIIGHCLFFIGTFNIIIKFFIFRAISFVQEALVEPTMFIFS